MTSDEPLLPLPLEGLRVLDVTHIIAGPFCSMILGDMGAEVIKIERPGTGERSRSGVPFVEGPEGSRVSARYLGVNRNKKSVTMDLRDPRCKAAFRSMVEAGDVVIFHSLAVHKALPNRSPRLRQSVDARYQRADAPTLDKHLKPYGDLLSWEAIYAGWRSDRLKYYWRAQAPRTVPWDSSYYDKRDEIAFEMAARGDESARLILLRVVQQNPDPRKRAKANKLLVALDGAA